jgi:hypothetical protein
MRSHIMSASRPPSHASTAARAVRCVPLGVVLAATLYAGLRTHPEMRSIPGVPVSWGDWLDRHDFLKNVAGFAVLTAATHLAFPGNVVRSAIMLAVFVAGIELFQLSLPRRVIDVNDVVAGCLGVMVGTGVWLAATAAREPRKEIS